MRNYIVGFGLIATLLLSGCSFGSSVEEELSNLLSDLNKAEEQYRGAQEELNDLEKSEQALFNDMMKLTQEQHDELETKVIEVEESLEKRIALIEEEEESMKKAVESVGSFDKIVEKAEDETKSEIEKLKVAMNDRYDFHSVFIEEYKKLTELQRELYALLDAEETELPKLQELVDEVNEQNEVVIASITSFNDATATVNEIKEDIFSQLKEK